MRPIQGFSDLGEEFQAQLLLPIDRHINDPYFADADIVADSLVRLIRGISPRHIAGEL